MAISGLQGPLIVHLISIHPISSVSLNLSLGFVWFKPLPTQREKKSPQKNYGFPTLVMVLTSHQLTPLLLCSTNRRVHDHLIPSEPPPAQSPDITARCTWHHLLTASTLLDSRPAWCPAYPGCTSACPAEDAGVHLGEVPSAQLSVTNLPTPSLKTARIEKWQEIDGHLGLVMVSSVPFYCDFAIVSSESFTTTVTSY